MVFEPRQKRASHNIQLLINGEQIDQVKETVFLGVVVAENLNWKSEISYMANKVYWNNPQIEFLFINETFTSIVLFSSLSLPFLLQHSLGIYLQS